MTAAIFGLLGVIVGGLIAAGAEAWFRSRERKAEALVAARLVLQELGTAAISIDLLIANDVWPIPLPQMREDLASTAQWEEGRAVLARTLSGDEWRIVTTAYGFLGQTSTVLADDDEKGLVMESLRLGRERITEARGILARHAAIERRQEETADAPADV